MSSSIAGVTASMESLSIERQTALVMTAIDVSASMNCTEVVGRQTLTAVRSHRVGLFGRRQQVASATTVTQRVSRLDVAKAGTCKVIDALSNGDLLSLLSFGSDMNDVSNGIKEIESDSTKTVLKNQVSNLTADGQTRLYDTIIFGCYMMLRVADKLAAASKSGSIWFCVVTDGEDTRSDSSLNDVLEIVRRINTELGSDVVKVMLIGVMLSTNAKSIMHRIDHAGGAMTSFYDARNLDEVSTAFDEFVLKYQRIVVGVSLSPSASFDTATTSIQNVNVPAEIRPGALVAVKDSVSQPKYSWGNYKNRTMHGLVMKVDDDGDVWLQLGVEPDGTPTESLWRGYYTELEVIDDGSFSKYGSKYGNWNGKIQLGQAVRVPLNITEPSTSWGSLKRGEVGYVRGRDGSTGYYVCDFPSVDGWKGREQDLEVEAIATCIRPNVQVRVRSNITPASGWGSVMPSSIGSVISIRYDGRCIVNFPQDSTWIGYLSELESINCKSATTRAVGYDRDGTKNCSGRHGLRPFYTSSYNHKVCDFCGTHSGPQGSLIYGCTECDCDACAHCYDPHGRRTPTAPSPPTPSNSVAPIVVPVGSSNEDDCNSSISSRTGRVSTTPSVFTARSAAGTVPTVVSTGSSSTRRFKIGTIVTMKGFRSAAGAPYNGKTGKIIGFPTDQDSKYHVQCLSGDKATKMVAENNISFVNQRYKQGEMVEITGIKARRELNGCEAIVETFVPSTGRYAVKCRPYSERISVLTEHLKKVSISELT